ncbi:stalk domain-containing protein [Anaerobacillus alkaliphilus]|uniref:stalk domain-containing protein n=1 Tax=Anaerobacillus alkaliphilus TaxID=1548597 RepID=UPI0013755E6F|nr:stalk domain-containing protein [Anaerobacillus alkaliphilus]
MKSIIKLRYYTLFMTIFFFSSINVGYTINWHQANGNETQTRFSHEHILPPLVPKWTNRESSNQFPVIDGHTIYVTSTNPLKLQAIELTSGKVKWEYTLGGSKQLPPLARDGIIYVGNATHYMAIQDLNTHPKVLWSVPLVTGTVPSTVFRDTIYVSTGIGNYTAIDRRTGARKWGNFEPKSSHPVAIGEGRLYGASDSDVFAYVDNGKTYTTVWTRSFWTTGKVTQPIYKNGMVYVGFNQDYYALNARTGNVVWRTRLPGNITEASAIGKNFLFLNIANKTVIAIHPSNGNIVWRTPLDILGAPLVVNDTVYLASNKGLYGLSTQNGTQTFTWHRSAHHSRYALAAAKDFIIYTRQDHMIGFLPHNKNIRVMIDGKEQTFNRIPKIVSGRTLVPMRALFEAFDANVSWNGATRTVTAKTEDTTVELTIDKTEAYVNGKLIILDVPATIIDSTTYVPIRFISESLEKTVTWDGKERIVDISSVKEYPSQKLIVNGTVVRDDIKVTNYHGTPTIHADPIFQYLGGGVQYHLGIGQIIATVPNNSIVFDYSKRELVPNLYTTTVDGKDIFIKYLHVVNNQIPGKEEFHLDLTFFQDAFNWTVQWDREQGIVNIKYN